MSDLVRLKYGYDLASNRKYRLDEAATANGQNFDERYSYANFQNDECTRLN